MFLYDTTNRDVVRKTYLFVYDTTNRDVARKTYLFVYDTTNRDVARKTICLFMILQTEMWLEKLFVSL